jgi:PAS domain S-box-containing protein
VQGEWHRKNQEETVNIFFKKISRWLDVPSTDPDDARRRKLLNIILASAVVLSIILLVVMIWLWFTTPREAWMRDVNDIFWVTTGLLVGSSSLFFLNRTVRGSLARVLFLILMTVGIAFADTPQQLVAGRSTFLFAIPIILASVLLPSWTAFLVTALCIVILGFLQIQLTGLITDALATFLGFAFISLLVWLSSRSLERALADLRQINVNLDRLVQERTKELADALSRERIESGRTKAILESIADGVIVFDMEEKAIIANPSSGILLEMTADDLVGKSIQDLSQSKSLDPFNQGILHNLLNKPSSKSSNYHIQWGKKALSVTSAPVVDTDGHPLGTVAVFRDYTHEAEVERMKNTFLAIVSHELRTPLNAILGYAEMLKEAVYGPVNEKQSRAAERIMTNSHRLLDIVSDLLDKAQMEAGKLSLHLQSFRPADLVENVHVVMDKIAADKGLALTSELDPNLPEFIIGDIARLQQILVNLINNSVKFTEKGSVHMCLSRKDKKHWVLGISDSGIGIPQDELPNIFEAFRQVDSTATRKYGGFGLGLSIVKQLSELMEGDVAVSSKLGTGSNFIVTLPLIQAKRS